MIKMHSIVWQHCSSLQIWIPNAFVNECYIWYFQFVPFSMGYLLWLHHQSLWILIIHLPLFCMVVPMAQGTAYAFSWQWSNPEGYGWYFQLSDQTKQQSKMIFLIDCGIILWKKYYFFASNHMATYIYTALILMICTIFTSFAELFWIFIYIPN